MSSTLVMTGDSQSAKSYRHFIEKCSDARISTLLLGENWSGRELILEFNFIVIIDFGCHGI